MKRFLGGIALAVLSVASAHASLIARAGGLAFYDDVLDITWLADANRAKTSGYDADGRMSWWAANAWIASLNTGPGYLGVTTWRLPDVDPVNGTPSSWNGSLSYDGSTDRGFNINAPGSYYPLTNASEMAYLFYTTLGNTAPCNPSTATFCLLQGGAGLVNKDDFLNLRPEIYWSGTSQAINPLVNARQFNFYNGFQGIEVKGNERYAMAVAPGDVLVPVPAAVWLLGSAVGVLGVLKRRVKAEARA